MNVAGPQVEVSLLSLLQKQRKRFTYKCLVNIDKLEIGWKFHMKVVKLDKMNMSDSFTNHFNGREF